MKRRIALILTAGLLLAFCAALEHGDCLASSSEKEIYVQIKNNLKKHNFRVAGFQHAALANNVDIVGKYIVNHGGTMCILLKTMDYDKFSAKISLSIAGGPPAFVVEIIPGVAGKPETARYHTRGSGMIKAVDTSLKTEAGKVRWNMALDAPE